VGYDEGGQLTEAIRRRPYSVVLLDEIEKAHPDVFNILLQVLDDGRLTDNKGRTANFRNTIIIMTSNLGADIIRESYENLTVANSEETHARTKLQVFDLLKRSIRPEFLNRIDDVVVFKSLDRNHIHSIIDLELGALIDRIEGLGYGIEVTAKAKDYLVDQGYDEKYGARPLKRAIQKHLEDPFAEEIIKLTGTSQKVIYKDLPVDDPKQRRPDISKAKAILGWEPKVDRAEGLKITYEYFKSLPEEELYKKDHKNFDAYTK
jgi:ATP-dependent Clp protease ATP-binding subunit ClpC